MSHFTGTAGPLTTKPMMLSCLRLTDGGASGAPLEIVLGPAAEEFSWQRESATTQFLRMGANTAMVFASNIAPVTLTHVQTDRQVW